MMERGNRAATDMHKVAIRFNAAGTDPSVAAALPGRAAAERGLDLFGRGLWREAMPFIERAAAQGDARSQYILGTALFNGDHVPRDVAAAFEMMQRSCDAGLPQAAESLRAMRAIAAEAAAEAGPDDAVASIADERCLLSASAVERCRRAMSAVEVRTVPPNDDTLEAMMRAMVSAALRERLETLIPHAIDCAIARLSHDRDDRSVIGNMALSGCADA